MKKLTAILLLLALLLCSCASVPAVEAEVPAVEAEVPAPSPSEPATTPEPTPKPTPEVSQGYELVIEDKPAEETAEPSDEPVDSHQHLPDLGIIVKYKDADTEVKCMQYLNGRLYLHRGELEASIGKTADGSDNYLPELDDCICLADVAEQYGLAISINSSTKVINLYDSKLPEAVGAKGETEGYIRLEDVMADGAYNDGGYWNDAEFSDYNLEKLRSMGEYLESRGQKFYVAWIPVYADPTRGVVNNCIENQCLYNADFIYSLDYLRIHGGKIVLHGYTHQQYEEVSAVGNEFGGDTEYTIEQMGQRMDKAIEMAKTLGYECDAFEFPHYALIESSRALAEARFDYIYQYGAASTSQITTVTADGKTTTYVPTPPDYVYSTYDQTIFDRLEYAYNNGQLMSLFFHPVIDFNFFGMKTEDGFRYFTVDTENAFLPRILNKVEGLGGGYVFSHFN